MGYVPTHGPNCQKVDSKRTTCQRCWNPVIYFECSCGSRVFLDPGGGEHNCNRHVRGDRARLLIAMIRLAEVGDPDDPTECPMCKARVKSRNAKRHFKHCPKRKSWFPVE